VLPHEETAHESEGGPSSLCAPPDESEPIFAEDAAQSVNHLLESAGASAAPLKRRWDGDLHTVNGSPIRKRQTATRGPPRSALIWIAWTATTVMKPPLAYRDENAQDGIKTPRITNHESPL